MASSATRTASNVTTRRRRRLRGEAEAIAGAAAPGGERDAQKPAVQIALEVRFRVR